MGGRGVGGVGGRRVRWEGVRCELVGGRGLGGSGWWEGSVGGGVGVEGG